jgi:hypothetical protein
MGLLTFLEQTLSQFPNVTDVFRKMIFSNNYKYLVDNKIFSTKNTFSYVHLSACQCNEDHRYTGNCAPGTGNGSGHVGLTYTSLKLHTPM